MFARTNFNYMPQQHHMRQHPSICSAVWVCRERCAKWIMGFRLNVFRMWKKISPYDPDSNAPIRANALFEWNYHLHVDRSYTLSGRNQKETRASRCVNNIYVSRSKEGEP